MTGKGRSETPSDVLACVDTWLASWFEQHLNPQEMEGRTDEEFAAVLLSDLHVAGFVVAAAARSQS